MDSIEQQARELVAVETEREGRTATDIRTWQLDKLGCYERTAIKAVMVALNGAAEIEKQAARYRWLRDVSVPPHNFYLSVPIEFDGVKYTPAEVDAAIDAAIAALKEKTP